MSFTLDNMPTPVHQDLGDAAAVPPPPPPAPSPRMTISDLPTELKSMIAQAVYDQDQAYKTRIGALPQHERKTWTGGLNAGRGTSALRVVNAEWNRLASRQKFRMRHDLHAPGKRSLTGYTLQIIKSSNCIKEIFNFGIAVQHGSVVEELVFVGRDVTSDSRLLASLNHFPHLRKITFDGSSLSLLFAYRNDSETREMMPSLYRRAFEDGMRSLNGVTELCLNAVTATQLEWFVNLLPELTALDLAVHVVDDNCIKRVWCSIIGLNNLIELKLRGVQPRMIIFSDMAADLPHVPTLLRLSVEMHHESVFPHVIGFAKRFSTTLESLRIDVRRLAADNSPRAEIEPPSAPISLPEISHLAIKGEANRITQMLPFFAGTWPLRLSLDIVKPLSTNTYPDRAELVPMLTLAINTCHAPIIRFKVFIPVYLSEDATYLLTRLAKKHGVELDLSPRYDIYRRDVEIQSWRPEVQYTHRATKRRCSVLEEVLGTAQRLVGRIKATGDIEAAEGLIAATVPLRAKLLQEMD